MQNELLTAYDLEASKAAAKIYFVEAGHDIAKYNFPSELKSLAAANGFEGETGEILAGSGAVLLGIGNRTDPFAIAAAANKLPGGDYFLAEDLDQREATLASLGWLIGGYKFDRYKNGPAATARLIAPQNADIESARRSGDAVFLVRDLVNTPAGDLTPAQLENAVREATAPFDPDIEVTVGDDLIAANFPMVHAVGRAADAPPRLIDLQWGPKEAPKVTLVGKGVTFDSGGLNMKGVAGMALMKKDMGGAAHGLALAVMIMSANLQVRLRLILPAVENAVSGNSFRPGDILASRKGLSVEIGNTDAEGRLILGDGLALGGEDNPDLMVSLATLTGAARVALGPELVPFYCDDDETAEALGKASTAVADPVWRMPLWRNYDSMLSSPIADVNHIASGSFAGSITAALFLRRFVPDNVQWIHFDMYAWRAKAAPGRPVGGEAQAIRALYEVIAARYRG